MKVIKWKEETSDDFIFSTKFSGKIPVCGGSHE
jgi:uncharacterized protein YecE (DUF72 family)